MALYTDPIYSDDTSDPNAQTGGGGSFTNQDNQAPISDPFQGGAQGAAPANAPISDPFQPAPTPVIQATGQSTPVEQTGPLNATQYAAASITTNADKKQAEQDKTDAERRLAQENVGINQGIVDEGQAHLLDQKKNLDTLRQMSEKNTASDYVDLAALHKQNEDRSPDHWWNSRTTGQKLQASIGIILGGLGQGLQQYGGAKNATNSALDFVDNTIKQDIELQDSKLKENFQEYAQKHGIRANQENFEKFAMVNKEQQHMNAQQVFKNQLALATAKAADPVAKANGQEALVALDQQDNDQRRSLGGWLEKQAAAKESQVVQLQKDKLKREQDIEDKKLAQAAALELGQQKAEEDRRLDLQKAPERQHQATLAQIAVERGKLQAIKAGATNSVLPDGWFNGKEKGAQQALEDLDRREKEADEEFLKNQKEVYKTANPAPAADPNAGKVLMTNPTGGQGYVPAEQVKDAESKGYKRL